MSHHKKKCHKNGHSRGQTAVEFLLVSALLVSVMVLIKEPVTRYVATFMDSKVAIPMQESAGLGGQPALVNYYHSSEIRVGAQ